MQYQLLFEKNPLPMWVVEPASLRFLAINDAAIRQYGYTREEFLAMTLADIRRPEYVEDLLNVLAQLTPGLQRRGTWIHRRKDGSSVEVEIVCQDLDFQGSKALLVAAYDITARNEAAESDIDLVLGEPSASVRTVLDLSRTGGMFHVEFRPPPAARRATAHGAPRATAIMK